MSSGADTSSSRRCARALALSCALVVFGGGLQAGDREGDPYVGRLLGDALADLQTDGLKIIYSSDLVTAEMRVEHEPAHASPPQIIRDLVRPHGLDVRAGPGGTLLIVKAVRATENATGRIRGTVRNRQTLENLPATEVFVLGTPIRVVTGTGGKFLIPDLPPGVYTVETRRPGFVLQHVGRIAVGAGETAEVAIDLSPAPVSVERVSVSPSHYNLRKTEPESRDFLSAEEIERLPHLGDDLNHAVSWLPGVTRGDTSAGLNIRGGIEDEVTVVLDGLEIYEPYHLTEMFTIVDSGAIGGAELMTGAFPAEYGDSMSGIIETFSAIPDNEMRTSVGLSSTHARVQTEGGFDNGRAQWLLSARQGNPEFILDFLDDDKAFAPSFYDVLGKMQYQLTDHTSASANVLAAYDHLEHRSADGTLSEDTNTKSGIAYAWLTFKTAWSPRLFSQTVISLGRSERDRFGNHVGPDAERIEVTDLRHTGSVGFKSDWSFEASPRHLLKSGLDIKRVDASYEYTRLSSPTGTPDRSGNTIATELMDTHLDPSGYEYGIYVSDRIRVTEALTLELGVRGDMQTYTRIDKDDQISPRINVSYAVGRGVIRAGWGRYYQSQGINELQVEDGVTEFFPFQQSEHLVVGYDHQFANGLGLRVEAYRKDFSRLRPRYENVLDPFGLFPEVGLDRVLVAPSGAQAQGIELAVRRNHGKLSWWGTYTLASAEDHIDGEWVARSWDQRHALTFGVNYRMRNWNFNVSGEGHSGWPTTGVTGEVVEGPDGSDTIVAVVGSRNAKHYPYYQRIDLRVGRDIPIRTGRLRFYVEILNVFDHDNPCCVSDLDFVPRPDGSVSVKKQYDYWIPRLPSVGVSWEF